jgi:predicted AAA+ superfamily ATPase
MTHDMYKRLIEPRLARTKKSVLLLGARQVGKSTLCRNLGPDVVINLADEATFLEYAKDPARLRRQVAALARPSCIFVDEVQRIPSLLNTIQALLDEGPRHRFLLTGSSARKLKRGGANLLPGRIILEHLDPLSYWELGESFDLDRALRLGTLPGIYADADVDTLETYATVYLREEIRAEAIVRDVGAYARFLDVAAAESGAWINYSKLASDAEIPKETVRRFYQMLEDTLLAFRVPPFTPKRSPRHVSQRDRLLIFDVGVRNALLGTLRQRPTPSELGSLFEQWLVLQCLYFVRAHHLPWRILGYRTDSGAGVDIVIDRGDDLLAVECKRGRNVNTADLRGIKSFMAGAQKPVRGFVVFAGDRAERLGDHVLAVPYLEFLRSTLPHGLP